MSPLAVLAIAVLLPAAVGYAVIATVRWMRRVSQARHQPAPAEPLEQLAAKPRRLRSQLEETETKSGIAAKSHRVRAIRGAYLDVLSQACGRLEVSPPPGGDRPRQADIYRAEAELCSRREPPGILRVGEVLARLRVEDVH